MTRLRFLMAALAGAALLPACGSIANTGLQIEVFPPVNLTPGSAFDTLYVDVVTEDGQEHATTQAITSTTEQPYTVIALMNNKTHTSAVITTKLYLASAPNPPAAFHDRSDSATVVQGKLTEVDINLRNTGN